MKLDKIQKKLESIYRIGDTPKIEDFIVSTDSTKQLLDVDDEPRPQVLFFEAKDEAFFGVHFGDERLERLAHSDFHQISLQDFLSITEELSHFVYLTWSAQNDSPVSLLDVELQGEIDKYLLSYVFREEGIDDLLGSLFENFSFRKDLSEDERERYEEANRLGRKVCQALSVSPQAPELEPLHLQWLREFYRLASQRRLSTAENL